MANNKRGYGKYDQATRNLFHKYRQRGLKLTYEEFIQQTSSVCYYCAAPPSNVRRYRDHKPYVYNGLDRLDPSGGYTKGNVVPCCWRCNKMKSNLTHDQFLEHMFNVLENLGYD